MHLLDLVIWIQADLEEAKARGLERDGGDAEAAEFWEEWNERGISVFSRPATLGEGRCCGQRYA